jgi:hypothetical protein
LALLKRQAIGTPGRFEVAASHVAAQLLKLFPIPYFKELLFVEIAAGWMGRWVVIVIAISAGLHIAIGVDHHLLPGNMATGHGGLTHDLSLGFASSPMAFSREPPASASAPTRRRLAAEPTDWSMRDLAQGLSADQGSSMKLTFLIEEWRARVKQERQKREPVSK